MTTLTDYGDAIIGERIVYVARKRSTERLIMKSGAHRGISGTLYDAKCWIERPIQIRRKESKSS